MSAPPATSVSAAELSVLRELGIGGQGTVVLVQAAGLSTEPVAFKEYSASSLADVDVGALERLVALPGHADERLRNLLLHNTAWPLATVHRDGAVCGFLMPAAPEAFRSYLRLPTGYQLQLLAMEFLLNPPDYMANVDLPVTEQTRLALLRELAVLLRDLHRYGVVVGDVSPKNVLISLRTPRCYLLDCDAMRVDGCSVLPQVETPDWRLPSGEELATEASDRFKFALLVIRLLRSDQSASSPEPLRQAQPVLADLAARSRAGPAARPTWDEWIDAFSAAIPLASTSVPMPRPAPQQVTALSGTAVPRASTQPVGAPAPPAVPAPKRRTALAMLAVAGVLAVLIGVFGSQFGGDGSALDPAPGSDSGQEVPAGEIPSETSVGMVDVTSASGGLDARPVAELFDAYFQGVNSRDWETVLALYDPAGVVDATDPEQRRTFTDNMGTTMDYDVRLLEVQSAGSQVLARVAFRSEQARGYGPKDDPDQTCTLWDITFVLTPYGDGYRILRPDRHTYWEC